MIFVAFYSKEMIACSTARAMGLLSHLTPLTEGRVAVQGYVAALFKFVVNKLQI